MYTLCQRARHVLDLKFFNQRNSPDFVSGYRVKCPYDHQYILRMIIRHGHGEFCLPYELAWATPIIMIANDYQERVVKIRHLACYITVRHGLVTSETDDVPHTDGFSTKINHLPEQNYIVTNVYPTRYISKAIEFPKDFNPLRHNVHKYIQTQVGTSDQRALGVNRIYCIDPYCIHLRPEVPEGTIRTFVRVSFVPIEIMDDTNTPNPLLPMPTYSRNGVVIRDKLQEYR